MDIQDLGSIGELVAAIATLGYLAYQLRLNNVHSRAYTQRDILRGITADHANLAKTSSVTRRGLTRFSNLSPDEQVEFAGVMLPMAANFEATLRLHHSGLVNNDLFVAHRAWILAWLTTPGGHEWWNMISPSFSADARKFIDSAIRNKIDLPPPMTEAMPFYGVVD
jgi:hypothetical protein